MRLIFDARHMQNKYTGLGRYTSSLLRALLASYNNPDLEIVVILNESDTAKQCEALEDIFSLESAGRYKILRIRGAPFSLGHHMFIARTVNRLNADLYFYPHFDLPLGIRVPTIFVIHDLLPLIVDNYIQRYKFFKRLYFRSIIQYAISRAKLCFAVSETTRSDLLGLVGVDYDHKVSVAYEGSVLAATAPTNNIPISFHVPDKFLLYVGDRRPHKKLVRVIDLFNSLKKCGGYSGRLVIAGSNRNFDSNVDAYVAGNDDIQLVGNVSDDELGKLYQLTDSLIFLSEYEGFGLPVVEAAAYGKRMILSDGGSLAEIAPPWACVIPRAMGLEEATKITSDYLATRVDINPAEYNSKFDWELTSRKIFPEAYLF